MWCEQRWRSWKHGRLSFGVRQQSACLFIHFLLGCTNRSTSCLLSMMLSSRQEITCDCFSHRSFSSLRSSPLMFADVSAIFMACFISILILQTTFSNDLSISCQQILYSSSSPLLPSFIRSCHCSFELNGNMMHQSKEPWCGDPTAALVMFRNFLVFEVTLSWCQCSWSLEEMTSLINVYHLSQPLLINYLGA